MTGRPARPVPIVWLLWAWATMYLVTLVWPGLVLALAFNGQVPPVVGVFTSAFVHVDAAHLALNVIVWLFVARPAASVPGLRWVTLLSMGQLTGLGVEVLSGSGAPVAGGSFLVFSAAGAAMFAPAHHRSRWLRPAVMAVVLVEALSIGASDGVSHIGHLGAFAVGVVVTSVSCRRHRPAGVEPVTG